MLFSLDHYRKSHTHGFRTFVFMAKFKNIDLVITDNETGEILVSFHKVFHGSEDFKQWLPKFNLSFINFVYSDDPKFANSSINISAYGIPVWREGDIF